MEPKIEKKPKIEKYDRGITFDGFEEVMGDDKHTIGHYVGLLWTISRGKRVEVEIHMRPEELPNNSSSDNYKENVEICKEKLRDGIKRLREKVEYGT